MQVSDAGSTDATWRGPAAVGSVVATALAGGAVVSDVVGAAAVRRSREPRPLAAPQRVAVLRALPGLGDLLCAVPALRAVRATWPKAHVTLLGLPQARWFVERYPHLVDELLPVEGVGALPEVRADRHRAQRFLDAARQRCFDLAIQAHGSGIVTNRLLTLLGAHHLVSVHVKGHWAPPGTSIVYPDGPEIVRLLRVVAAAGCHPRGLHLELPISSSEEQAARRLLDREGLRPGGYVCLHPGASMPSRRWPAEHFTAVADQLVRRGLRVVLTGSAAEQELVRRVIRRMARPRQACDLSGRTGVGSLAALYRQACLVVTNDTGASHVAAAAAAASVVVTSSPDPWRWAPLDRTRHTVVTASRLVRLGRSRPGSGPQESSHRRSNGFQPLWPTLDEVMDAIDAQLGIAAAGGRGERRPQRGPDDQRDSGEQGDHVVEVR